MEQNETTVESGHEIEAAEVAEETTTEEQGDSEVEMSDEEIKDNFFKLQRLAQKKGLIPKKEKKPAPQPTLQKQENNKQPDSQDMLDKLFIVKDFSPEEINKARTQANDLGVDVFKFIQSEAGQTYIDKVRNENRVANGTPTPSRRGVVFKGKTFNEVIADPKASDSDKQAAFEASLRRGKGANASI